MRHQYLDNLTGLLIIQMIFLCHVRIIAVGVPDDSILYHLQYFLVFFMPWFFYKSGMFYSHRDVKDALIKDTKKLLIPFVIYVIYAYAIQVLCIVGRHEPLTANKLLMEQLQNLISYASVPWNQPLWFLVSLFLVRILYNVAEPLINKYVIILSSLLVAFLCRDINIYANFWIGTTFQCLFFYGLGHVLKESQYKKSFFLSAILIYTLCYCFSWIHEWDARINNVAEDDYYLLTIVVIVAGIIVFNNIFKRFLNYNIPILNFIGKKSMLLFGTHFPCIMILYFYLIPYLGLECSYMGFFVASIIMTLYLAIVLGIKRLVIL